MKTTSHSADELAAKVGETGKCFIATDGEKIVGTVSCRKGKINRWFYKGYVTNLMLFGILPEYQGKHIASKLIRAVEEAAETEGCNIVFLDTAAENDHMIQLCKRKGFLLVSYFSALSDHYSVEMAKWLDNCPYSKLYCSFRFFVRKLYIRLRFKPGKKKRFGV